MLKIPLSDFKTANVPERVSFLPMRSSNAVTEVFSLVCRNSQEGYSPHSV